MLKKATGHPVAFPLQIIRILHRLLVRVFHEARVAPEGIGDDGFIILLFHTNHSPVSFPGIMEMMVAFLWRKW